MSEFLATWRDVFDEAEGAGMGEEIAADGSVVKVVDKRAVTRIWVVLQKTGRVRDEYIREKTPEGRAAKAGVLVRLAAEIRALADEVAQEAGRGEAEVGVVVECVSGVSPS